MIRLANQSDVEVIFAFGKKFYETLSYGIEIEEAKGKDFIRFVIDSSEGLAIVAEDHGTLIGCILGYCQDHPFASCKIASELIWWMEPEYRGRRDSTKLFDAYEYWAARKMNADVISVVATPEDVKLHKYYDRKKYRPKEVTFMREFT